MAHFTNILAYVPPSGEESNLALETAVRIGSSHQASVTACRVVESVPEWTADLLPGEWDVGELATEEARKDLDRTVAPLRQAGLRLLTDVVEGRPAIELTRAVVRRKHDLVIKEAENEDSFLGTTAHRLMRVCPCPVWVVHPERPRTRRVLVAIDPRQDTGEGSPLQLKLLDVADFVAKEFSAELHVVHVASAYGEQFLAGRMEHTAYDAYVDSVLSRSEERLQALLASSGVTVEEQRIHVRSGRPAEVVLNVARSEAIDLLVLGTVARGGLAGLLIGNTAEKILRRAACSVLAVKPDGFVSPVR